MDNWGKRRGSLWPGHSWEGDSEACLAVLGARAWPDPCPPLAFLASQPGETLLGVARAVCRGQAGGSLRRSVHLLLACSESRRE